MSVRLGKYRIHSRLARGGMAEIFLATAHGPEGFSKAVVLKRLLPHLAERPEIVSMFLDEARLAAGLNHPHVVQIYDLGEEGGDHYLAMEYLAGRDLSAVLVRSVEKRLPLAPELVAQIAAGVAEGLHFAHEHRAPDGTPREIIHGDISPSNVVLTFVGQVKIVDFGIARAAGAVQAAFPGAIPGKLAYMPPEKVSRGVFDRRGDVFALGVVMHELLAGARLFRRDSEQATAQAVLAGEVRSPSALRPDVPESLSSIVLKALAPDPTQRFQTALELRRALEGWFAERSYVPSGARISEALKSLFGEESARRALAGPLPEPTATATAAEPPPAPVGLPLAAVPLVAEQRQRGRGRVIVRVVGEVPAALMKAGQELVAVPVHVLRSALRWRSPRVVAAALLFGLAGLAGGSWLQKLSDQAASLSPEPPPVLPEVTPPSPEPEWPACDSSGDAASPPSPGKAPTFASPHRKDEPRRHEGKLAMRREGVVYLRGERLGRAPLVRTLPPGSYDVALIDENGMLKGTWIAVVRPGLTTRLE